MQQVNSVISSLGMDGCDTVRPLNNLAHQAGLQRGSHLALVALLISSALIIVGVAPLFNSCLIGFVYPAYKTKQAIDSGNIYESRQWTTYWMIFSILIIFNGGLQVVLSLIPFYYVVRTLLLIYLFHPYSKGAMTAYEKVLAPAYLKYSKNIDRKINEINSSHGY